MNYLSRPRDLEKAKKTGDELAKSQGRTFLVVGAHPDDAEWWAGGTIALLSKNNQVVLILGTSGEAGADVPDLDKIRERQQREAAKIVGYDKVVFLRHPDRHLDESKDLRNELEQLYQEYKPDGVIAFDIEKQAYIYHHSDHIAAGRAAWDAASKTSGIEFYLYHTSSPNTVVDFGKVKEEKKKALSELQDYRPPSRLMNILRTVTRSRSNESSFESYGGRSEFSSISVEYGEVFRKVTR